MLGRDRNLVRHQSWHVYLQLHDDEVQKSTETINKLKQACDTMTGRKKGGKNEPLKMETPTKRKVQITWPTPVTIDSCTRVLRQALGQNWEVYVSAPSGTGARTQVPAATAETADEAESLEDIVGEAIEAAASADPASPAAAAPGAPSSEAPAREAYARGQDDIAHRRHHLLSMILETISRLYENKDRTKYEVPPCPFEVDWDAELGQGTFGKVYCGTLDRRPGGGEDDVLALYAIKMLRDKKDDEELGFNSDAVEAANEEVMRHAALGYHPNVVRLNDVGLFTRSLAQEQRQLSLAGRRPGVRPKSLPQSEVHIGLVFDLYEIDVRQFLEKTSFTQSGVRHVLNSVLAGLGFIHDSGMVHCDVKPANVLMRGTLFTRGCFEKPALARWGLGDGDADEDTADQRRLEFHYQIPRSFEALGSFQKHGRAQFEL